MENHKEQKTPEVQRRASAMWDAKNPEKVKNYKREWAQRNKDIIKRNNQKRYAKVKEIKDLFKELPIGVC